MKVRTRYRADDSDNTVILEALHTHMKVDDVPIFLFSLSLQSPDYQNLGPFC
jgi:hypothetical protein